MNMLTKFMLGKSHSYRVHAFKKFLKKHGAYKKFVFNLKKYGNYETFDDLMFAQGKFPVAMFIRAFNFRHTLEGQDYWENLKRQWSYELTIDKEN